MRVLISSYSAQFEIAIHAFRENAGHNLSKVKNILESNLKDHPSPSNVHRQAFKTDSKGAYSEFNGIAARVSLR